MKRISMVAALLLCAGASANADVVFTGTPEGSWSWSTREDVGIGDNIVWYPQYLTDFASAEFQGYVTYDPDGGDPSQGIQPHNWSGVGFDTIQVFSTYLLLDADTTFSIRLGGDDGHSLFVDSAFIDGGGFGAVIDYELSLVAGVPVKIEMVGFNGPGGWVFGIGLPSGDDVVRGPIDDLPGIRLNAIGDFSIPEPATIIMLLIGMACMFYWIKRRK